MSGIQGDALLKQTPDNGEIEYTNGLLVMTGGFETAFYLALFGGNQKDSGTQNDINNWWGNLVETDPDLYYRSHTQYLLQTLIPVSGNLVRLEEAVKKDLDVFKRVGAVDEMEVVVALIGVRKVQITITVTANGENVELKYIENWKAMSEELT